MVPSSPSTNQTYQLIYGGDDERCDSETVERVIEELEAKKGTKLEGHEPHYAQGHRPPSSYVVTFENMIGEVWKNERHLLTEAEWEVVVAFGNLCYNAKYCLVRLILRKQDQWHAVSSMEKYKVEVGEEGLTHALATLCEPLNVPLAEEPSADSTRAMKEEDREIIDLSFDSDEDVKPPLSPTSRNVAIRVNAEAGPSHLPLQQPDPLLTAAPVLDTLPMAASRLTDLTIDFFCEDEARMSLQEVLERLSVDQLRDLVRSTKITPNKYTKPSMISALILNATTQAILPFSGSPSTRGQGKTKHVTLLQTTLEGFVVKSGAKLTRQSQETRLKEMAFKKLGRCIKVNYQFYRLVQRLHVICYRCTEHPTSVLLPALLTSFKKRSYPDYKYERTGAIWRTREELLRYEEALELEASYQTIETGPKPLGTPAQFPRTALRSHQFVTPVTPIRAGALPTRSPSTSTSATPRTTRSVTKREQDESEVEGMVREDASIEEQADDASTQNAKHIRSILLEVIYPRWKELVAVKQEQLPEERTPGLERFEPGFVYTRMVSRSLEALGRLKDHQLEAEIIEDLLAQRIWRRGKRARLYDRRALLQTRYLCRADDGLQVLHEAWQGLLQALKDEDTGLILRPRLVHRLQQVEKRLQIPLEERCHSEGELKKAVTVSFSAIRIWTRESSLRLDSNGRVISNKENKLGNQLHSYFPKEDNAPADIADQVTLKEDQKPRPEPQRWKWRGKSIWRGIDGKEVNVELRALQYYEEQGFKGFHSETRILTTIFALLMWDIIFCEVQGAFETAYQSAPLDMMEDSFYYARKAQIDARLLEIENGKAREIIEKHDGLYREKGTWCIGVRWDICGRDDLFEIVELLGGPSLSIICRLFCEDYSARSSGVPDLIVWNTAKGQCKFVEVKGPGDTPQDNQRLWFDSLLGAGASVEICKVVDSTQPVRAGKRKRKESKTKRVKVVVAEVSGSEIESEDDATEVGEKLWVSVEGDPQTPVTQGEMRGMKKRRLTTPL